MKIVRLVCFFALIGISEQVAYAQDAPAVGVMVGGNLSYFATSPENETTKKPGVMIGVFGALRRDRSLKILPELQFAQRRVDVKFGNSTSSFTTSYLNLGLMTRLKLFKGIYTTQGGQFSFPMRSKLDLGAAVVDIKDNISWDFSIPAGVGRQFGRVGIEGRWESGLKRVEKAPLGNFIKRNRAITLFAIVGL
jgi:hypothetical protein